MLDPFHLWKTVRFPQKPLQKRVHNEYHQQKGALVVLFPRSTLEAICFSQAQPMNQDSNAGLGTLSYLLSPRSIHGQGVK